MVIVWVRVRQLLKQHSRSRVGIYGPWRKGTGIVMGLIMVAMMAMGMVMPIVTLMGQG